MDSQRQNNLQGTDTAPADAGKSYLYERMISMRSVTQDFTHEQLANVAYTLFTAECNKYADANPEFPARSELKLIYALQTTEGSEERYIYQPYLDLYPDQDEALRRAGDTIRSWSDEHPNDAAAQLLRAGVEEALDDQETVNAYLYRVLELESRGVNVEGLLAAWVQTAYASDFAGWYERRFGPVTIVPSRNDAAGKTAAAKKSGAAAKGLHPLKETPGGRALVIVLAILAVALRALVSLMNPNPLSILWLIPPVLLLVFLFLDKPIGSAAMALPETILLALLLMDMWNMMSMMGFQRGLLLSYLPDLVLTGLAVLLLWILAARKTASKGLAGLLIAVFVLWAALNIYNGFVMRQFGFQLLLLRLGDAAMVLAYAGAVFFAGRKPKKG